MNVSVEIDDLTKAAMRRLTDLQPVLEKQAQRAMDEAAASILNRLRETFLQEVDPMGVPWVPSKAGLRRKAQGSGQTLFDTGTLWRSIQLATDMTTNEQRVIATDVRYAPFLQNHETVPRVFLAVGDEHIKTMEDIFRFRMNEALQGAL
jgi:phage gpG-like protein